MLLQRLFALVIKTTLVYLQKNQINQLITHPALRLFYKVIALKKPAHLAH
jgi:hypothetical protein